MSKYISKQKILRHFKLLARRNIDKIMLVLASIVVDVDFS